MRPFAVALVVLLVTSARADEPLTAESVSGPVQVTVRLSPAAPVIGDVITLEIEARAEAGVELLMPAFGEALDRFRVVAFVPGESVDDTGGTLATQRYTLQSSRSGSQSIPPLLVEFVDRRPGRDPAPEGEDAYELLTERVDFEVSSVLPEGTPLELRPALGALSPRRSATTLGWPLLVAGLVLVAAAALFAVRAWLARNATRRRSSAYEVARRELDALLYGPRPDASGMDGFFVKLSGVVRRYLEDRFGLRSPELTTEEFLEELSRSPDLYASHRELLSEFLERADLVKFAGLVPDAASVQSSIESAQRFLEETREAASA